MAGFWHLSHHQMRDPNGSVYAGARATFFEAATLNPITVYTDYGLGTPHPNPVVANAYGVFPPVFFDEADGFYRQRVTTAGGVIIPGTDVGTLPIIGPGEGGGGSEVPVDPNALLQTGDLIWAPKSGSRAGMVRANGRTIGSATSGATERANSDCEALYLDYWGTYSDTIAPVTGGRGLTAAADWAANKPLTLLNMRNKGPFGLDDMGNTAAGGFAGVTFDKGSATDAASEGGDATVSLITAELPSHNHTVTDPGHTHLIAGGFATYSATFGVSNGSSGILASAQVNATDPRTTGITLANTGSGAAHLNMPPFMLGTWYQKL